MCCGKASHKKEKQSSVFCKVYHKDPDLVSGCQYFEMPIWQFSEQVGRYVLCSPNLIDFSWNLRQNPTKIIRYLS